MNPQVSVVIPVFNGKVFLREALDSVLAQTFTGFECVIVDDGSTDRSKDIAEEYARRDPRVRVISRPNTGIVGALNDGLAAATGELIARMDADDIALPQRFATQAAYLRDHPGCVAVGSRIITIDRYGVGQTVSDHPLDHEAIDALLLRGKGNTISHPTVMMRRDAISRVNGYRQEACWVEDQDLFLRLAEVGRLANLAEPLLKYRHHASNVSRARRTLQRQRIIEVVEAAHRRRNLPLPTDWPPPPPAENQPLDFYRVMAWRAIRAGSLAAARGHALDAVRHRPASAQSWLTLASVLRRHLWWPERGTGS